MTLIEQIFWGGLFLFVCLVLETIMLLWCADALQRHRARFQRYSAMVHQTGVLLISIGFVVAAHTAQIWIPGPKFGSHSSQGPQFGPRNQLWTLDPNLAPETQF